MFTLRPYQQAAQTASIERYAAGVTRQLVVLPTGTGKTVLFSSLIQSWPGKALVLAHRDRLIQQAFDKVSKLIPINEIGIVKAEQNRYYAKCVLASVQTLARQARLAKMPKFDLIIIDEAHRAAAKTYGRIIDHVRHEKSLLLGVTATPDRADGLGLDTVFEEIVYEMSLLDAIEQNFLVDLRAIQIKLPIDFSGLHTQKNSEGVNDYKLDEVASLMDASNWVDCVTKGWRENAADRRTIAFVPRVRQAYALAEYMRGQGIAAAAVDGSTEPSAQRAIVDRFERGGLQVLINCDLFVEGADIPSINCVAMCRPTKSRTTYCQAIGRGTRLSPETGKTDCLILDMVGVSNRLDLCTAASLIGVGEIRRGESLRQAKKREDEEQAEQMELEMNRFEGDLQREEVDLFRGERERRRSGMFEWQIDRTARQSVMAIRGHRYEISRPDPNGPYQFADMSRFGGFVGEAVSYTEAQARVEADARQQLMGHKPASEKQIALLTKNKIPFSENISMAEASDLLQPLFDHWNRKKSQKQAAA